MRFLKKHYNGSYSKDSGWVRLFGFGVSWKHERLGLLFSERNGYTKYFRIGKWIVEFLKPVKI